MEILTNRQKRTKPNFCDLLSACTLNDLEEVLPKSRGRGRTRETLRNREDTPESFRDEGEHVIPAQPDKQFVRPDFDRGRKTVKCVVGEIATDTGIFGYQTGVGRMGSQH